MKYFAYGSNMLYARLKRRVPSARPLGSASLAGHVLRFHKHGADGSGKCNAFPSGKPQDVVHGVLYEVDEKRLSRLHAAEGPGYEFVKVMVQSASGETEAFMYRARSAYLDDALAPYTWYQAFVVAGARENDLPRHYVSYLENLFGRPDPNLLRRFRNGWILRRRRKPPVAA